ncbi:hypothetical protein CDAR_62341 [Caerostris darwini]|uniref:Uncharacterized protein n=1 Tax=Caerostris darwini TaxID=1538125 RepID=A0AAV4UF22_9ARAC|nr:hypothetical protein CDAR_62341 [Caerostris darwini]
MDETRSASVIFFLVGLGPLAQYLYVHTFWSFVQLLLYTELMTVSIKENGGLKALISALDKWAAEVVNHHDSVLGPISNPFQKPSQAGPSSNSRLHSCVIAPPAHRLYVSPRMAPLNRPPPYLISVVVIRVPSYLGMRPLKHALIMETKRKAKKTKSY